MEVDLGCGKGRFLLARAARYPGTPILGIDRMLRRIRKIDNRARRMELANLRLLRLDGYYAVTYLLPRRSVSACYVFFPDPWPKKRHHGNRLFHDRFTDALLEVLQPGGALHVATDHLPYFEDIKALLSRRPELVPMAPFVPEEEEKTDFERWFEDRKPIGRCSFRLRD